jgi:hypothetical protein
MVIDRMSVLVLRRTRTAALFREDPALTDRVAALDAQLTALASAFDTYMDELQSGRRRFVPYEHLKLYGASAGRAD